MLRRRGGQVRACLSERFRTRWPLDLSSKIRAIAIWRVLSVVSAWAAILCRWLRNVSALALALPVRRFQECVPRDEDEHITRNPMLSNLLPG